ncbi:cytosol aminopeptidase [Phocicoccus schoeneichii]|uniref:Probable cytosol aminopeptidase n=1 Tax=Phocicoccus schoeneichii TaxID=1812261 RepID=A0A6V7R753_9BACL|nr:leucyl aminopeptidase family protein [Jeotgalicoccus schoeneichii]GGH50701.1 cytosol aminopeptidase [Jeotgalicoccus schoeneichii]CAD2072838.1 putative cytosol aminopeptidase [Jeotgalicoccus schoeneichii]
MEINLNQTIQETNGAIVIGLSEDIKDLKNFDTLDAYFNGNLVDAIESGVLSTKLGEVKTTGALLQTEYRKIITVGLGPSDTLTRLNMQEALGKVFQFIAKDGRDAAFELSSFVVDSDEFFYDIGLMSEISTYEVYSHKSREDKNLNVSFIGEVNAEALSDGMIEGRAINFARDFSEMPPNELYPETFAHLIVEEFEKKSNVTIDVKDDKTLEEEGYGLITAVGKGSRKGPRLVTLTYKHPEFDGKAVALVGKGITYDSGGYSLKPRNGMVGMKYDMSGAANVLGMLKTLVDQEVKTHVVAIVALAENMVTGDANRPDDVYFSKKGLSVEVTNTDAEGRLVLADAVYEATTYDPVVIMDFATLTGAVIGALGMDRTGLFTNKDRIFTLPILESSITTGEKLWHLPMDELEDKAVRATDSADLVNSNLKQPYGGASFAASFIEKFVEDYPWLHFDIAGTSGFNKPNAYGPKGASGVMIRTVLDYIKTGKAYD